MKEPLSAEALAKLAKSSIVLMFQSEDVLKQVREWLKLWIMVREIEQGRV